METDKTTNTSESLFNEKKLPVPLQAEIDSTHILSSTNPNATTVSAKERYLVLNTLGEGGMGIVQLVQDSLLCREVALKTIKRDPLQSSFNANDEKRNWRLKREAKITAILEHPNIIPLYDMHKKNEDELYFTMRKVEGETLASILQQKRYGKSDSEQDDILLIFHKICDAVAYAHSKGIIHRDLKPANIMIGQFGEVYVMDWGIAKYLSPLDEITASQEEKPFSEPLLSEETKDFDSVFSKEDSFRTVGGIGTQGYMSPEQARDANSVKEQADIFALGKILKQCFVYRSSLEELKEKIDQRIQIQKIPPRKSHSKYKGQASSTEEIPEDMQAIIQKATEHHWKNRYISVKALSADVERYRKNLQVSARHYKFSEIFWKWVKRNKTKIGIGFGFVGMCIALLVGFWGYLTYERREKFEQNLLFANQEEAQALREGEKEKKLKHFMKALNYTNSALLLNPKNKKTQQSKQQLSETLVSLACEMQNYQFASYIATEIANNENINATNNLEAQVHNAKTKTLKKHQQRLNYWKRVLQDPTGGMRDEALLEINKMSEPEIFEELVEIVQEGTQYFLTSEERTPKKNEYYGIMVTLLGSLENPNAGDILWYSLEQISRTVLRFEENKRPNADIEYMIALSEALANSKSLHHSLNFVKLSNRLGDESTFKQRIDGIAKKLIERDHLAEKMQPTSAEEYRDRAFLKKESGDFEGAIEDYSEAIRLNPQDFLAYYHRGNSKRNKNDVEGALEDYHKALDLNPSYSDIYKEIGHLAIDQEDFKGAIEIYTRAIQINPQNAYAYINRGNAKRLINDFDGAIKDYTEAIRLNPKHSEGYLSRGALRKHEKDYEGAIKDYSEAIHLNPHDFYIYANRGNLKSTIGDQEGAIEDCNQALLLNPQYAMGYSNRGSIKIKKEDYKGAIADFDEAIRINPQLSSAYTNRGISKKRTGDMEGALADFDEAIRINPQNFAFYLNRGNAKVEKGDIEEAIADFDESIRLNPQQSATYISRGMVRWKIKDFKGAIEDYTRIIEFEPSSSSYNNRGGVKKDQGDFEGAIQDYNEAIRLDPKFAFPYYNRGFLYQEKGNFNEALLDWEKGLALRQDPEILERWIRLILQQIKQQLAQKDYSKALESLLRLKQNIPSNDSRLARVEKEIEKVKELLSSEKK